MDPVQIVELLVTDPDEDTTYILKEKKLNKLCDQLGDRPLAVINVVGKSRTGKSFMLNYIGRYIMEKLQHKMAARSATPLTGFEWNNDSDLVTNGIWFSQPLIVTKESGDELAIILVDTQGLYDENFPESDSSAIVGLSLLVSSVVIFNVFSDLGEEVLTSMNSFLEFAMEAIETTTGAAGAQASDAGDHQKHFQQLVFMIRDWTKAHNYPYGGEGGQQYIESKFQVKRMHTASARSARQNIRNSFDDIDCYLMPERGPAAQGVEFDGRRDMLSPQFIEILAEFCQTVVAPDRLEPKSIGGRSLTGRAFGQYLKGYVNMFNSGQVRACDMLDATYKFADHTLINQIKDEYQAKLLDLIADDQPVLSAQDLTAETDTLADECRHKFETQKKSVNDRTVRELRDMLTAALTATAKQALDDNERRIQKLKEFYNNEVNRLKIEYDQTMAELFVDQTKLYLVDDLELEHTDTVTFMLAQLDQHNINNHIVPISQYKSILRDYCRGRYVDYRDKNQTRRQLAEVEARQQLQELCNQYDLELERLIKLGAGGADTFDAFKADAKVVGQRVLAEYLENRRRGLSTLNAREVTARFDELLADSEDVFLEQKRNERLSVEKLLDTALRQYTDRMAKHRANTAYIRAARLKQMHDNLVADLIKEHRDGRGHLTTNKFTQLITDLLDTAYTMVSDDNAKNTPTLPAIGIDLGTTNSCVAYYRPDIRQVVVFESDTGRRTTPSVVEYRVEDGEKIVGDTARDNTLSAPRQTVYSVKRLIGRKFSSKEVGEDRDNWPFRVVDMGQDEPGVEVETGPGGQTDRFMPEEVSAQVLKKMKETAERGLGGGGDGEQGVAITNCVITVPAYFNDAQRDATKGAATMAGLKVLKIINEPTAAALAYQLNRFDNVRAKTVLIYDFGGGTFDVSLLAIDCGEVNVLAVGGDNHLGGDDVDNLMIAHCMAEFGGEPIDMETDEGSVALRRVKRECENKKSELSKANSVTIKLNNLIGTRHMNVEITRRQFNDMCEHLFARTMACVNEVMGKAGKTPRDIDDVILVGGSTRIPYVQEMLAEFFDKEPCHTVHPDLAVAEGAAIQAAILNGNQAQQLGNLRVRDVTPFTLGVRGHGDLMSPIIVAQSPIPCSKAKVYRTVEEFQTDIDVVVYEGEEGVASANRQLGTFTVAGLPPLPAGRATIKVVFDLNDDGILNVRAVDPITGQAIADIEVVEHRGRLTEEELRKRALN